MLGNYRPGSHSFLLFVIGIVIKKITYNTQYFPVTQGDDNFTVPHVFLVYHFHHSGDIAQVPTKQVAFSITACNYLLDQ